MTQLQLFVQTCYQEGCNEEQNRKRKEQKEVESGGPDAMTAMRVVRSMIDYYD
jgi:hypothetical protein